jgi:iron(III) transport system permease protein
MALMNELSLYHILYLNIIASLVNIDLAMEEAAANLSCTGIKCFLKITLLLIILSVFVRPILVFI